VPRLMRVMDRRMSRFMARAGGFLGAAGGCGKANLCEWRPGFP
jgi:hypothetical protein